MDSLLISLYEILVLFLKLLGPFTRKSRRVG